MDPAPIRCVMRATAAHRKQSTNRTSIHVRFALCTSIIDAMTRSLIATACRNLCPGVFYHEKCTLSNDSDVPSEKKSLYILLVTFHVTCELLYELLIGGIEMFRGDPGIRTLLLISFALLFSLF